MSSLFSAFLGGAGIALVYLALLWVSVRRLPRARHQGLWLAASAVARLAIVLAGFYWLMDGQWQRLLACVAGFTLARLVATGWIRLSGSRYAAR